MFGAALIVFRESLEAALIIGVMAAATRGVAWRGRWIAGGILAGLVGSALVASSMSVISNLASGVGQELFNASILTLAVCMLAWHNIWMANHGRELAARAQDTALAIQQGSREGSVILLVVGLAVMREGSETVLFLYGLAAGSAEGMQATLTGALLGVGAGAMVGGLLYLGLLRIPLRWFFSVTAVLVLLLAASMASQVARNLIQADIIPSLGAPLWNSSSLLSQSSPLGTVLHGLVGYDSQPAGAQLVFYLVALIVIGGAMFWVGRRQPQKSGRQGQTPAP
ncbi:MAG: FTR1 family protein [Betaproteobacteria bacterium]